MSVSFGPRALFQWKGKSCSDSDARSCWLDHGDLLVMDGQYQDEFLHCTNPGSQQERITVTFRWIQCCLPTCAQGSSVLVTELAGNAAFWGFWVFPVILSIWLVPALLAYLSRPQDLEYEGVAYRWTRRLGGGRWEHYLRGSLGAHWFLHQCALKVEGSSSYHVDMMLYVLAFVRLPSLLGYYVCFFG